MNDFEWAAGVGEDVGELLLVLTVAGSLTAILMAVGWQLLDRLTERRRRDDKQRQRARELDFTMDFPYPAAVEREWRRRESLSATWPSDTGAPE